MGTSLYTSGPATFLTSLFLIALGAFSMFFGLPNPVQHVPYIVLLYPLSLFILAVKARNAKRAFMRGWLLGLCANAAGLYWMVFPMHDVAGIPFILAIPGVLLLHAYLALFPALATFGLWSLFSLFARGQGSFRYLLPPFLGGLAFGGFEVLCGKLLTGFPWLSISTAFAFVPEWTQAASLVGGFGLSALYACAAFFAATVLLVPGRPRRLALVCALGVLLAIPSYGMFRLALPVAHKGDPLSLVMVQGNIDQSIKWEPAFQKATLTLYLELSKKALAAARASSRTAAPELVLWPETAMPFYFQLHQEYAAELRRFAQDNGVYLAFGTPGILHDPRKASLLNRLYLLSPTGATAGFYDKEHLVPFGEYMPFAADIPFLTDILQGMSFVPGTHNEPMKMLRKSNSPLLLGTLVCYEAIFPSLAQARVAQGAQLLINISNDGWFRKSSAPLQHLAHAALRSVEQARSQVRATNTGITAVLDARGRIVNRLNAMFAKGILAAAVQPGDEITAYHRLHPLPELLMAALALLSLFSYIFGRKH